MCLSFANLKEKKGKYNGCNWEVVTLEVVQTCTFVPKETQYMEGRQACPRVVFLLSSVPPERPIGYRSSGGSKAASVRRGSCWSIHKRHVFPSANYGVTSPAWTCGEQSEASAAESWRSIFSRRLPVTSHFSRRNRGSHRAHWGQTSCYPRDLKEKVCYKLECNFSLKMRFTEKFS